MKSTTQKQLAEQCASLAVTIDDVASQGFDAIADFFDFDSLLTVEFRIDARFQFRSAKILLAGGGPTIFFDTSDGSIRGYWGFGHEETSFVSFSSCEEINDFLADEFDRLRDTF